MNCSASTMSSNLCAAAIAAGASCASFTLLTPRLDPSRAGLIIRGRPRFLTSAAASERASATANAGTSSPTLCHTHLLRSLSMPSAEPNSPLPVYGRRSASSAPCITPSSPPRPCSAMNTRSKSPSASTRNTSSPASRAWALLCYIRRRHPDDAHLGNQAHAMRACDRFHDVCNQGLDVGGACGAGVDDEIGVLGRDAGPTDTNAFQSRGLDEPRRVIAGRIAKHGAAARETDGLRGVAALEQLLHACKTRLAVAGVQLQLRCDAPLALWSTHVAIPDLEFLGQASTTHAAMIDRLHRVHQRPGLAAEGTRIHRERAAHRARNAGEKFAADEIEPRAKTRDLVAGNARADPHACFIESRELAQCTGRGDHRAAYAAVADQHVAAEPKPEQRLVCRQVLQKHCEIIDVRRLVIALGGTAHAPGVVTRERLVVTKLAAERRCLQRGHHDAASLSSTASRTAAAPMSPAPKVSNTSPSRSTPRSTAGSCEMSSTNTGSTLPRPRIARLSARPSAPAMAASPAAYTSSSTRASTCDSTMSKSSNKSRVRVLRCG